MDEKISFIPKKTLNKPIYIGHKFSFFLIIGIAAFLISGLISGGAYFYKRALEQSIGSMEDSLKKAEDRLDMSFIMEVRDLDAKIKVAENVLNNHKQLSGVFEFLEQSALQNMRFSDFHFSYIESQGVSSSKNSKTKTEPAPTLSLKGIAAGYTDLALQSREFSKSSFVKSVSFSNLILKEKGQVDFDALIVFDPSHFIYQPKQ